ncbi:spore coat protein [Marinisporobacter balticus]|uniref:Spore coat protein CotF n=1 Tax=Marinisporobacter balticus TaxID=2018667 RepID=A0A4R2KU19_9FIRM|nr:spore coat protein CotF [Marinisporobacter balticus]
MNLSQKEKFLLEDQKSHEEACVQKYQDYANQAQDPQLKQLFGSYATQEQQHLDTINQILGGQVPSMNQQSNQQGQNQPKFQNMQNNTQGTMYNPNDAKLCKDVLMAEKYVSSTYNTAIFECRDTNIRQVLNHIQKEEQEHGEGVFNYMLSKGMYQIQ